jgi:hypothetical protein
VPNAASTQPSRAAHGRVDNVGVGDLWYFPKGIPHSIQGLGPDGCEFLLVFDDGSFSEETEFPNNSTLFLMCPLISYRDKPVVVLSRRVAPVPEQVDLTGDKSAPQTV